MTVTFDDGRVEHLVVGPRDQLAWEAAEPGRAFGALFTQDNKISDYYSLAFAALRRQGKYSGTLKDLKTEADVELGREEPTEPDPTQSDHSTDDSPS